MKTDEDVNMVSSDAPIIMSKACELFIVDLALRAQFFCKQGGRKILSKEDICKTISNMEMFDFLIDIVPKDNYVQPYINQNDGNLNSYFEKNLDN